MSWNQFAAQLPNVSQTAESDPDFGLGPPPPMRGATDTPPLIDRVVINAPKGADVRNVQELQGRLRAAGGSLIVGPNSSDYIVAINNNAKFSITRQANGQFLIRESQMFTVLIGAAVIMGLLLVSRAR